MMGLPTSLLLQSIFARFSILPSIEFREKSEKKSLCFWGVPKLRKGNAKLLKFIYWHFGTLFRILVNVLVADDHGHHRQKKIWSICVLTMNTLYANAISEFKLQLKDWYKKLIQISLYFKLFIFRYQSNIFLILWTVLALDISILHCYGIPLYGYSVHTLKLRYTVDTWKKLKRLSPIFLAVSLLTLSSWNACSASSG
jgi:hypothetical protein